MITGSSVNYFLLMHKKLSAIVTSRGMSWFDGRNSWTILLLSVSSNADFLLSSSVTKKLFACKRTAFSLPTLGSMGELAMMLRLRGNPSEH